MYVLSRIFGTSIRTAALCITMFPSTAVSQTAEDAVNQILLKSLPHFQASDLKSKSFPAESGRGRIVIEGYLTSTEPLYKKSKRLKSQALSSVFKTPYARGLVLNALNKNNSIRKSTFYKLHRKKGDKKKFFLEASYSERVSSVQYGLVNFDGDIQGFASSTLTSNAIIENEPSYVSYLAKLKEKRDELKDVVKREYDELLSFILGGTTAALIQFKRGPSRSNLSLNQGNVAYRTASLNFDKPSQIWLDSVTLRFEGDVHIQSQFSKLPKVHRRGNYWPRVSRLLHVEAEPAPTERYFGECRMYSNGKQCYIVVDHPLRSSREKGRAAKSITSNYSKNDLKDVLRSPYAFGKLIFQRSKQGPALIYEGNRSTRSTFVVPEN